MDPLVYFKIQFREYSKPYEISWKNIVGIVDILVLQLQSRIINIQTILIGSLDCYFFYHPKWMSKDTRYIRIIAYSQSFQTCYLLCLYLLNTQEHVLNVVKKKTNRTIDWLPVFPYTYFFVFVAISLVILI